MKNIYYIKGVNKRFNKFILSKKKKKWVNYSIKILNKEKNIYVLFSIVEMNIADIIFLKKACRYEEQYYYAYETEL